MFQCWRCLHSWGLGASRFSQKWATLRQSHARSIIKIVDLHFTFQSTRLFSNETTEIPALAPCKMEVTLMIYVDCKSLNMSEWWPHSKARARPRDHVWRLINALGCNSTNLMRFSSFDPKVEAQFLSTTPHAQLPGPSHFVSCQRNSGLLIRHGPAPHHRLKSAAGLVDEVHFKMFKAQNFWMSWLFTNPDMRDRGIAVNNHGGCRKFWAPQALPDSKVSLIKPLPRRKQIRF